MAPVKFGLFKARSRDHQEQPSTENLLDASSTGRDSAPSSPVASTSKSFQEDIVFAELAGIDLDSDEEEVSQQESARPNEAKVEEAQGNYHPLSEASLDLTASTFDLDQSICDLTTKTCEDTESTIKDPIDIEDASTSCDANSIQFDETSIAASEDLSVYCGTMKKQKKSRTKEKEQHQRDLDMWKATDVQVMQNLLSRTGTHDDRIKWEAIATARGLCTLTDTCSCGDCAKAKYLAGVSDGDAGLGNAAPLISAMSVGCILQ